jgi:hypothetical protein
MSATSPSVRTAQTRTGAAPNVMACLRNLVIGVLSRAGPVNVARRATPPRPRPTPTLATLGISLGEAGHHDRTTEP